MTFLHSFREGAVESRELMISRILDLEPSLLNRERCEGLVIDKDIPVFKDEGREYVNSRVYIGEGNE